MMRKMVIYTSLLQMLLTVIVHKFFWIVGKETIFIERRAATSMFSWSLKIDYWAYVVPVNKKLIFFKFRISFFHV